MRCLSSTDDPRGLYRGYVRELVIAGTRGNSDRQRTLARRYDRVLPGLWRKLDRLPDDACYSVFRDALRAKRGQMPQTELGRRLAYPAWFRERVPQLSEAWWELEEYQPAGLAIDPVCEMLVDPASALVARNRNGAAHFFCCPACRSRFLGSTG